MTIVRTARPIEACGRSMPKDLRIPLSPWASPRPATMPTIEASTPMANASSMTERMTCRREAPIVRSIASSRERWATVIESVL